MRTDIEAEGAPIDPAVHRTDTDNIHSVEQYEAATQRVRELFGCNEGSPEDAELEALVEAIFEWDKTHDDATPWRLDPARGEPL
jgi:hypothetical protein